jgi:hypothetical protein
MSIVLNCERLPFGQITQLSGYLFPERTIMVLTFAVFEFLVPAKKADFLTNKMVLLLLQLHQGNIKHKSYITKRRLLQSSLIIQRINCLNLQ